jgi:hypothetical protein
MLPQDIHIDTIVLFLKELPNKKKFSTPSIAIARGMFRHRGSLYQRFKRFING